MLDYVADYERNIRKARQHEGVVRAKEKGVVFGRSKKTVSDFEKASETYGIKARPFDGYSDLDKVQDWFLDDESCLINI